MFGVSVGIFIFFILKSILIDTLKNEITKESKMAGYILSITISLLLTLAIITNSN